MSRAPFPEDDFSFLPKVDDAEALDKEALLARVKAHSAPTPQTADGEGIGAVRSMDPPPPEPAVPGTVSPEPARPAAPAAKGPPRLRLKVKPTPRPAPEPEPAPAAPMQVEPPVVEIRTSEATQTPPEKTTRLDDAGDQPKTEEPELHTIIRPPGAEDHPKADEPPLTLKEKWRARWIMIGGQSLAFSVILHLVIVAAAALIVFKNVTEQHVDFLPGGGTTQGEAAEKSLAETVRMRRTPWVKKNPMQRVASSSSISDIKLPEPAMDSIMLPDVTRTMGMTGFGSAGAGGGFGSGIGVGGKSGVTFQPIMMFGRDLKAKRMAVILDVSSSMADYLEDVVKEVDRVAKGSPVICYFGCGLMRPEGGAHIDDKVDLCKNPTFERFWRLWYGPAPFNAKPEEIKKIKFGPKDNIPFEKVYRMLARRPGTYFVDYNGIVYAWTALVNDLVRNADALYWFSDFMDDVDEKEIKIVLENLKRRKQRLFIQPSIHGSSFEQVRKGLVIPTGGEVVEPPAAK